MTEKLSDERLLEIEEYPRDADVLSMVRELMTKRKLAKADSEAIQHLEKLLVAGPVMDINEAAKATRKYAVWCSDIRTWAVGINGSGAAVVNFQSLDEAMSACDRLNLIAVLEAIREPSMKACAAAFIANEDENPGGTWRAMIDALKRAWDDPRRDD